jgi:hypothetical protein
MALTNEQKRAILRKVQADVAAGKPAPAWSKHSSSATPPERGVLAVIGPKVPRR